MKKISIIIVNWNGEKIFPACLNSLKAINCEDLLIETIIVDNGSTDNSISILKNDFPSFKLIVNSENLGFAEGNNIGINQALKNGSDYVVLLNNDTVVDSRFISELILAAESDPAIGIVGPKIYFAEGYEYHKERYKKEDLGKVFWYAGGIIDWNNVFTNHRGVDEVDSGQYEQMEDTDFVSGCCMLVKKEVFKKVGLLDSKYYLYYEETDFEQRTKKLGYRIIYAPKSIIWHLNAASSSSGSTLQDYYITRNRMIFGMRYAPIRTKIALIRESLGKIVNGAIWARRGILDFYLNKLGKGSYQK